MARQYMITSTMGGTTLQIDEEGTSEEVPLEAASDQGRLREAEEIINSRYYRQSPFAGFHWQSMSSGGWLTTDHDLKS